LWSSFYWSLSFADPHSAVRLVPLNEDPTTTYINANYVRGYNRRPKAYIATQGPIPSTRNDFWRMIWEQHVSTIIMTTGLVERGRMKCCRYWPDTQTEKEATYGNYTVRVVDENPDTHYAITTLTVKDNNQGEDHDEPEIRTVKHYWFTGWPDFGIPRETGPVLDFLAIIQKETAAKLDPVLVHCSAGIGRTGTFMAIELGMQQYLKEGVVDPLQYMCSMRQDRGGSIQTADQYLFIHKALADFIARVAK
jgi:protein tyrosine phosphatase